VGAGGKERTQSTDCRQAAGGRWLGRRDPRESGKIRGTRTGTRLGPAVPGPLLPGNPWGCRDVGGPPPKR